jgi:hypothetical protein
VARAGSTAKKSSRNQTLIVAKQKTVVVLFFLREIRRSSLRLYGEDKQSKTETRGSGIVQLLSFQMSYQSFMLVFARVVHIM